MPNKYHTIYLSPHLDDAVLSCGMQLFAAAAANRACLVVTLMAGDAPSGHLSDYARSLHARWQLPTDAVAARRQEDKQACAGLGADVLHWDIPDCIYRFDPEGGAALYQSDAALFERIHPADERLADTLANRLAGLPSAERIVAPLTVGHHVDHQLTRLAAERCFGPALEYYEDFPYVQTEGSLDFLRLWGKSGPAGWCSTVFPAGEAAMQAKIEAILQYRSQLSTFFEDRADLEQQVRGYTRSVGGERLWLRNRD